MSKAFEINPRTDLVLERFIDAPRHLVWEALTKPEHLKEWYMPRPWGAVSACEMDVRPGGIFGIDITTGEGQEFPNLGCFLEVVPMERLVWNEADFENNKASGWRQGTEIALDQFVAHVKSLK